MKKLKEVDGGSVWGPCVESLLGDVIVKWHVPLEVVGGTSLKVSPFGTCGADREHTRFCASKVEAEAWQAAKKIEDEIKF